MSNPSKTLLIVLVTTLASFNDVQAFSSLSWGLSLRTCGSNNVATPFAYDTELAMAKKKKKKKTNKKKSNDDSAVAVLERPPEPVPVTVEVVKSVEEHLPTAEEIVAEAAPENHSEPPATPPKPPLDQKQQPLSAEDEAKVAAKYAAIEDVGERAFTILADLGFFDLKD